MRFYRDMLTGGSVCHCGSCRFGGDMLDLMGAVWKLDDVAVCGRIRQEGIPGLGNFDVSELLKARRAIKRSEQAGQRGWLRCSHPGLSDDKQAPETLERLKVRLNSRFSSSKTYCPQIFGCTTEYALRRALRGNTGSNRRAPQGQDRELRHALVLPFYDLPYRIVGFLLLSRAVGSQDITSYRVNVRYGGYHEAGVASHPSLMNQQSRFLFITPNPTLGIHLWARCTMQHYYDFPLVVANEDTHAWQMFGGMQRILIAYGYRDLAAFRMAARLQAKIYVIERKESIPEFASRCAIASLNKSIPTVASDWQTVLSRGLSKIPFDHAVERLAKLQLSEDELLSLRSEGSYGVHAIVDAFGRRQQEHKSISFRSGVVVQDETGLYFKRKQQHDQILNAVVSINKLIKYEQQTVAHVLVAAGGKEFLFQTDYDKFTKNTYHTLHSEGLRHNQMIVSPAHWHKQLCPLILRLSPPRIEDATRLIGYSEKRRAWITPTHEIRRGLIIKKSPVPAWLEIVGALTPDWRKWKRRISEEQPVNIAATLTAVDQLIAAGRRETPPPVFYTGAASLVAVEAVQRALSAEISLESRSRWLCIPTDATISTRVLRKGAVERLISRSAWVHTNDLQRCYGAFLGGLTINSPAAAPRRVLETGHLTALVLTLLKHWRYQPDTFAYAIEMMTELGITIDAEQVLSCVQRENDSVKLLTVMLKELQNQGQQILDADNSRKAPASTLRPAENGRDYFVPTQIVERVIAKTKMDQFNNIHIIERLSRSPFYHGFIHENGLQGWLFDQKIVDAIFRQENFSVKTSQLKIVG